MNTPLVPVCHHSPVLRSTSRPGATHPPCPPTRPPRSYNVTRKHMDELCESIISLGYQFILLDCPAGIDVGFINAISPAKEALIVTTPEITSIRDAGEAGPGQPLCHASHLPLSSKNKKYAVSPIYLGMLLQVCGLFILLALLLLAPTVSRIFYFILTAHLPCTLYPNSIYLLHA